MTDTLGFIDRRFATHGDTYHLDEGGGKHLYVTRDPAHVRTILVDRGQDYQKRGSPNDRLVPVLGDGLLTADGEAWKRARRLLQPAFHRRAIAGYGADMVARTKRLSWTPGEHDIGQAMMHLTLGIACKSLFDHELEQGVGVIASTMSALNRATEPSLIPDFIPTPSRRRSRAAVAAMDALVADLIRERRAAGLRDDLLSMLLGAGLPDREVRDQLVTLFLAGHETTSHALSWTLWLLARHPDVERRLHEEIDALDDDPEVGTELPYTDAVLSESMRMYPPAYALPRVARVDTQLGDFDVPAGTQIVMWIWHMHRHPAAFDEPTQFRPERFIDRTPEYWMPFGAGSRKCIGSGFAQMEMRLVLATLARRWRFHLTDAEVVPAPRVTLAPRGGLPLRVERRTP